MKRILISGLGMVLLASSGVAAPVSIFSNYTGTDVSGSAFGSGQALAVQFTPASAAYLTDVQIFFFSGGNGFNSSFDVFLLSYAAGTPTTILETLGTTPTYNSSTPSLLTLAASGTVQLQSGVPYWMAVTMNAGSAVAAGWGQGGSPTVPTRFAPTGGINGSYSPLTFSGFQFSVNGDTVAAVPEASSYGIAGAAMLAVIALSRRRNR